MKSLISRSLLKYLLVAAVILFPIALGVIYATSATAIYRHYFFPKKISILTGTKGGLYRQIGEQLKLAIEADLGIQVELPDSEGAMDNLIGLQRGSAQFALYQPGTYEALSATQIEDQDDLATVANLYSQPLHLIVRRGAGIEKPHDLIGKRVQVGLEHSGDYAMCRVLLNHLGIREDQLQLERVNYHELKRKFVEDEIDAACITLGVQAPIFAELFESGQCHLLSIPFTDALLVKNVSLLEYEIPQGLYRSQAPIEPEADVQTVAQGAQLLCRQDIPTSLVTEITRIVMSERFQIANRLGELHSQGSQFAELKPEFTIHTGAKNYYHSEFDVQVFEGWEALYSLAVSMLIAGFLLFQSIKKMTERNKEHKLDQYVRKLLKIERSQLDLDQHTGAKDIQALQRLLDEVTQLRQQALQEFTSHEINEDRAVDSFVEMCHALNNKINAKLSRQRIDHAIERLIEVVENQNN